MKTPRNRGFVLIGESLSLPKIIYPTDFLLYGFDDPYNLYK